MDSKLIIGLLLCIIIVSSLLAKYKTCEEFSMFSALENPGGWIGNQISGFVSGAIVPVIDGVWGAVKGPAVFARDVYYNVAPNYTMVNRYLAKKNDWVRANKGIPLMNPANGSVSFKFDDKRDDSTKRVSATVGTASKQTIGSSVMNKIF